MNRPHDRRRRNRGGRRGTGRYGGEGGRSRVANSQIVDNTPVPEGLVFYCKTCERILDFHPQTFNFKYPIEGCPRAAAAAATAAETAATLVTEDGAAGGSAAGTQSGVAAAAKGRDGRSPRGGRPRKDKPERQCEIVYGTERSIKHYFKIPDSSLDAKRREEEERAARADKL